jgi:hypothetical protein
LIKPEKFIGMMSFTIRKISREFFPLSAFCPYNAPGVGVDWFIPKDGLMPLYSLTLFLYSFRIQNKS